MRDGYRVEDESLRLAILAAFEAEENPAYSDLRVGVLNGIAHLAGSVNSGEARKIAEQLVGGLPGVRAVVNRINAPGAPSPAREINLDL